MLVEQNKWQHFKAIVTSVKDPFNDAGRQIRTFHAVCELYSSNILFYKIRCQTENKHNPSHISAQPQQTSWLTLSILFAGFFFHTVFPWELIIGISLPCLSFSLIHLLLFFYHHCPLLLFCDVFYKAEHHVSLLHGKQQFYCFNSTCCLQSLNIVF